MSQTDLSQSQCQPSQWLGSTSCMIESRVHSRPRLSLTPPCICGRSCCGLAHPPAPPVACRGVEAEFKLCVVVHVSACARECAWFVLLCACVHLCALSCAFVSIRFRSCAFMRKYVCVLALLRACISSLLRARARASARYLRASLRVACRATDAATETPHAQPLMRGKGNRD